ncbi:hypothetical protein COOONC_01441 [Cooperia oncophora]
MGPFTRSRATSADSRAVAPKSRTAIEPSASQNLAGILAYLDDGANVHGRDAKSLRDATVSERSKEATAQITRYAEEWKRLTAQIEEQTKELQDWKEERKEHSRSSSPRTGCKRRHGGFEIPPSELQRYERILDQSEKELTEIDDFLSRNVVKDRRFGSRNMKEGEGGMTCVYCKEDRVVEIGKQMYGMPGIPFCTKVP